MYRGVAALAALMVSGPVLAQAELPDAVLAIDPAAQAVALPAAVEPAPAIPTITIPRLTDVVVEVMADLSSNENVQGETFPIRLMRPIVVNGVEVVPAGVEGMGEIVHAKRSGGMGSAGEMLLTARYLDYAGQRIELRSFAMGTEARSRIDTVNQLAVASAVAFPALSLVGFFIQGDALRIASGTPAVARLTNDEIIALAVPADAEPHGITSEGETE